MKKYLFALLLGGVMHGQTPVAPISQPHVTFVDGAGLPCAGCKLQSYAAGTTTPLATYTDATGTSQNTNPIILDAAGGANIWVGANSYKFILINALGTTIWSVDQVNAGNLFPCGTANAIQVANGAANGLACDSTITINTTTHTISIGTLPANHVTIGALGTPTLWNFDTTSPATALASLGGGSVSSVGLALPSLFAVTGSPVTNSGTLTATLTNQAANTVVAGPASGAAAPPTLRALVPADLPVGSTTALGAVKCDGTTITCTAGVIAAVGGAPTCNTNGCYITLPGGTILQWGVAPGIAGGGVESVAFPTAFTSTTRLTVNTSTGNGAGNIVTRATSITTSGFTAGIAGLVFVGGSGSAPTGAENIQWFAIGN